MPELAIAAEIDGQVVGAAFGLPDYNPRIKEIDGRLFPFGFIHLLRNKRPIKRIRLISTNVLPEYQRMGLGLVLMHGIVPKAMEWGMEEAEFSWVLESNSLSRGALKKGGAKITKTYRLYDLDEPSRTRGRVAAEDGQPGRGGRGGRHRDRWKFARSQSRPRPQPVPQGAVARFMPKIRTGCRRCCWKSRSSSIAASIPSTCTATADAVHRPARRRARGTHPRQRRPPLQRAARRPTSAASACSSAPTTRRWPTACWTPPPTGSATAAARRSCGPIDYSINYPCGLLVEGFDTPPRIMDNHNPPYYAGLLESWGLAKAKDLYSWWFVDPHEHGSTGGSERAERLARRGKITIRPFRIDDFEAEVRRCQDSLQRLDGATTGASSGSPRPSSTTSPSGCSNWPCPTWCCWPKSTASPVGFSITAARHERGHPPAGRPADPLTACRSTSSASCAASAASRPPA